MKGRICYACFWSLPSFEKLLNVIPVKSSFLRPVTLTFSQREPFKKSSVAGYLTRLQPCLFSYRPATGFFFAGLIVRSGRPNSKSSSHRKQIRAGHFYFAALLLSIAWSVWSPTVSPPAEQPNRPPTFPGKKSTRFDYRDLRAGDTISRFGFAGQASRIRRPGLVNIFVRCHLKSALLCVTLQRRGPRRQQLSSNRRFFDSSLKTRICILPAKAIAFRSIFPVTVCHALNVTLCHALG